MLTPRAAVLGSPIAHSLSPVLHRAAYRALGLDDWDYTAIEVGGPSGAPDLATFLRGADPAYRGFSVTYPLKEDALALAVDASAHARLVGAANTLVRTPAGWVAHSTDAAGVRGALDRAGWGGPGLPGRGLPGRGLHGRGLHGRRAIERAVLLGSGATARSVLCALADLGGVDVTFLLRGALRAQTAELLSSLPLTARTIALGDADAVRRALSGVDVIIGTLPTGTDPGLPPVGSGALAGVLVMDCAYGGWPTPLARWAFGGAGDWAGSDAGSEAGGASGATVVSGLDMLVCQAAEQVALMTGRDTARDVAVAREAMFAAAATSIT